MDDFLKDLWAIYTKAAANSHGRVIVKPIPEDINQHAVFIDMKQVGRTFELQSFMAKVAGVNAAMGDVGTVFLHIKAASQPAYDAVKDDIRALAKYANVEVQDDWRAIW